MYTFTMFTVLPSLSSSGSLLHHPALNSSARKFNNDWPRFRWRLSRIIAGVASTRRTADAMGDFQVIHDKWRLQTHIVVEQGQCLGVCIPFTVLRDTEYSDGRLSPLLFQVILVDLDVCYFLREGRNCSIFFSHLRF